MKRDGPDHEACIECPDGAYRDSYAIKSSKQVDPDRDATNQESEMEELVLETALNLPCGVLVRLHIRASMLVMLGSRLLC
jgi:hypothetical protein